MTMKKARALADALMGEVLDGDGPAYDRAVGVTIATSAGPRFVRVEEGAGARYFDRHAATTGYETLGDDPRGVVDAEEWHEWDSSERWALGLASLLGEQAEPYHSGGNIWLVYYTRLDGKCVCLAEESVGIYPDRETAMEDPEGGMDDEGVDTHLYPCLWFTSMTFEEFRASGRDVPVIEDVLPDAVGARAGRLYCNDRLYIEDTSDWADGGAGVDDGERGRWYLTIANMEYASDHLSELESKLFEFAWREGYEIE
jgi:hypothetical protein